MPGSNTIPSFHADIDDALLAAVLRNDFLSFARKVHETVAPGVPFVPGWYLEALAWHLEGFAGNHHRRLLVTLPPRSMKSTFVSVGLVAWLLGQDPAERVLCVSYGQDLAAKFHADTRRVMESGWYRDIFPGTRIVRATETEILTNQGGGRLATSVGGTLTGRGATTIIIDDPHKADDAHSATALARVIDWYSGTLLSRLDNKRTGGIAIVMQRIHVDDLAGHVLAHGGWRHLNLPAIAEVDEDVEIGGAKLFHRSAGDVLQPIREPISVLTSLKKAMGSAAFSAQYQQAPVPPGGNMLQWEWFKRYDELPNPDPDDFIIQSWDTAQKATELSDYSVGITVLVRNGDFYVIDLQRRRMTYPELRKLVILCHRGFEPNALIIEDAGSGISLIQDLKIERIRAIPFRPKVEKVIRVSQQSAKIEAGHVFLPRNAKWLDDFRTEALAFPLGTHDDQVDALAQALAWYDDRRRGTYTVKAL